LKKSILVTLVNQQENIFPILTLEEIENETKPSIRQSDVAEDSQPQKSETLIITRTWAKDN